MITRDDWLKALTEAQAAPLPDDPTVLTLRELGELLKLSREQASRKVQFLVEAGKAERTTKLIRRAGDMYPRKVNAYRLLVGS
jgi:predicted transcriptional regulator